LVLPARRYGHRVDHLPTAIRAAKAGTTGGVR
jgi:hypothetical protein